MAKIRTNVKAEKNAASDQLEIVLQYSGPAIEDGAMAVEDLVPVLQGIAGAYGKVAASRGEATQHKLRLIAIRPGSAKLILDVWKMVDHNAASLQAVGSLVAAAMAILGVVVAVIQLKKHTKGEPYKTKVEGTSGLINVINSANVSLAVTVEQFELFKDKALDVDLARVAKPLEAGSIDESKIEVTALGHAPLSETITASERSLFDNVESVITSTSETWVIGHINSMTKSTNSGHIYLNDGTRVYFRLKADNPSLYYGMFGHNGLVKVRCVAHMDESLHPTSLDIFEMIQLQPNLPFDPSSGE